jgi:hypothetical protein
VNDLLTAARDWYDAGYCVIPAHEDGGKRPFGAWKQYQHARPDWEQVRAWLESGRYSGIGVLTGGASGNVEMLELEGPMDAAVERLGRVFAKADDYAKIGMPDLLARVSRGCVEQSAGGGLHLFIRVTDGPAKGNTKLARTADGRVISETRGEGGFVIVAPTPGRNGHAPGAAYIFINGGQPSNTVDVTSEDRDLLHLILQSALEEYVDETPTSTPSTPTAPSDGVSAFDDFRARVTWRDILLPKGWREGPTMADGHTHWTRPGGQKFEGTSATTLEDGPMFVFSTSVDLPQEVGLSKGTVYAHLNHGGDMSAAARDLTERGYGTATLTRELPAWEAGIDPDATPEERQEAASSWVDENLPRVNWAELWQAEHREEWIVEPLLAARRLVALYSAPKVGKSLLMLEIAAAVAAGRGMFGYEPPKRPYRTLYVDFENDPRADIRERLTNMGYGPDDLDNLVLLSFPNIAKFDTERGSQELMAAVHHYETEIVVIDTVSRAVEGEENENDTWLNFYKHTGLKMKQAGVALIRLDHSGKDESKGQRGGSAKSGDVDAVWRMSKSGEEMFDLVCEAQRFPIAETSFTVMRVEDPLLRHVVTLNPTKEKRESLLVALAEKGISKDPSLSLNEVKKMARAAGISFDNRGTFNAEVLDRYRAQVGSWTPSTLPGEAE